jgi:hypothetical protein
MDIYDRRDRPPAFPAVMLRIDTSGAATFRNIFTASFTATGGILRLLRAAGTAL